MYYIKLYELLKQYEELLPDTKDYLLCKDKKELADQYMLSDIKKAIQLLCTCLVYEF